MSHFILECEPRIDYGRQKHTVALHEGGAVFNCNGDMVTLRTRWRDDGDLRAGDVRARFSVEAGETKGFLLETGPTASTAPLAGDEGVVLFEETVGFWRRWLRSSTYSGRWREMVDRSAMSLKLMTYAPHRRPRRRSYGWIT